MKSVANKNFESEDHNSPRENKKYPGYTPDKESGNTNTNFSDIDSDNDSDLKLADKGPIRNPNYHNMDDVYSSSINYRQSVKNPNIKEKTLEDFNKTDPRRDINQGDVE